MSQGLCPSCGAAVKLTVEQPETKCKYCETVVTLQQAEAQFNEIKNSKFAGTLLIAETAMEGGGYEEAINYFNKVIEQQPDFAEAWLNKGICTLRSSKIGDIKVPEAVSSWRAAIKFAKKSEAMKKRVGLEINNAVTDFYPVLETHYLRFHNLEGSLSEHCQRFLLLETALSLAADFNPTAIVAKTGIVLCDRFTDSIQIAADSNLNDAKVKLFEKDWKGVLSSAAEGFSKNQTADIIQAKLETIKGKYEQLLSTVDSDFAAEFGLRETKLQTELGLRAATVQVKQLREEETKVRRRNTNSAGCGCLLTAVLFSAVGLFATWVESQWQEPHPEKQGFPVFLVSILTLIYAIRRYRKAQALEQVVIDKRKDERDRVWMNDLPVCLGSVDLKLGQHTMEATRFRNVLERAIKADFTLNEIRGEIEKYLSERNCTAEHIHEQLARFDSLTTIAPSGRAS